MKKDFISTLHKRGLLWPMVYVAVAILCIGIFGMSSARELIDGIREYQQLADEVAEQQSRVELLSQMDESLLESAFIATNQLLPTQSNVPALLSAIDSVTGASTAVLTDIVVQSAAEISSGSGKLTQALQRLDFRIKVVGSLTELNNFAEALKRSPRLITVRDTILQSDAPLSSASGVFSADIGLTAYYRNRVEGISNDAPLAVLTDDELDAIRDIRERTEISVIEEAPTDTLLFPPRNLFE